MKKFQEGGRQGCRNSRKKESDSLGEFLDLRCHRQKRHLRKAKKPQHPRDEAKGLVRGG